MQLTLVVPGLLDLPAHTLAAIDGEAPALSRLIASADALTAEEDGLLAAACRACGLVRQSDCPVAPRLVRALGVEPGKSYWLCAEPVSLEVGANDVRLAAVIDDLSPDDARTLVDALNAHFAQDRIEVLAPTPSRWFVRAHDVQRLSTRPPEAAIGAPLFDLLPRGDDSPRWRRWLNESQMILFEHPVNERRQAQGQLPANSLWLWGGGIDQRKAGASAPIFGGDARTRELAGASGIKVAPLPASLEALGDPASAVVWLDPIGGDGATRALAAIDRAWAAPASRALDAGSLSLEIVLGARTHAQRCRPQRSTLAQRVRAHFARPRASVLLLGRARESAAV